MIFIFKFYFIYLFFSSFLLLNIFSFIFPHKNFSLKSSKIYGYVDSNREDFSSSRAASPNPPPDINSHFLSKRIIVSSSTPVMIASLLYLQEQSNFEHITLHLMPPLTFSYKDSLSIIDVMTTLKCPIKTVGFGMLEGPMTLLLAKGSKGMRSLHANSFVSFTPIQSQARGQATDIHINAKIVQKQHEKVKEIIEQSTSMSNDKIEEYFSGRNILLDAIESLDLGIIDEII